MTQASAPDVGVGPGTALPWQWDENGARLLRNVPASHSETVLMVHDAVWRASSEDRAYIVRACNSFPDLLEALEVCVAELTAFAGCIHDASTRTEIEANIATARAAIAKARGQ